MKRLPSLIYRPAPDPEAAERQRERDERAAMATQRLTRAREIQDFLDECLGKFSRNGK